MSVIELKNISKSYGQGNAKVDALKDVNFEADVYKRQTIE